ncbi:ATP-binding protein [Furfurilactobacillus siliginis]|uniref:ATPase-like protein n=1 Tax=Furfurilactobacillus siliginis TaxID=348151 RepID=A0A0R2L8H0_9LACO|nr:ATP-binding protein [Furfurilactobacillus siliginis]KRN96070.1 ATPase-like protein [Furfurilactobacillus siliginis]GEK28776.1 hypothetical protein LSI01_10870 [Furfurilactobacillus siliginis]
MQNDWQVGSVELVAADYIEFSARTSDIGATLRQGKVQIARGINDFVYTLVRWNVGVLFRVSKVRNSAFDRETEDNSLDIPEKLSFTCEPVGTLKEGKFTPGIVSFPMVGDRVYGVNSVFLDRIFSGVGDDLVSMGTVSNYPDVHPFINAEKLLTSHFAILGNTGSGKSTTLRVLLDRLSKANDSFKENVRFLIFDVHGDYEHLKFARQINVQKMHLPLKELLSEDWEAALLPSEKTQKPILNRALQIARTSAENRRLIYAILTKMAVSDVTHDSFVMLKRSVTKWYTKVFGDSIDDTKVLHEWFQKYTEVQGEDELLRKISSVISEDLPQTIDGILATDTQSCNVTLDDIDEGFDIVFGEEEVQGNRRVRTNTETMMSRFRNLKSKYGDKNGLLNSDNGKPLQISDWTSVLHDESKFLVLNLTEFDDDALRLVSNYLVRAIFQSNYSMAQTSRDNMPFYYLYLDEAHRYVKENTNDESTAFEKIAREGRKFNIYLGIISQIPSELSRVVLSQTGAFFIHRIQNAMDLEFIQRNVPSATKTMVARLPSLKAGTVLLSGNAFDIPYELSVEADEYADVSASLSPISKER